MATNDDTRRFPSGRSVGNCRMDAKRLANSAGIPLWVAQERIAAQNGFSAGWAKAMKTLKPQDPASQPATPGSFRPMTADDVRAVLQREPLLTHYGYGVHRQDVKAVGSYGAALEAGQRELLEHLDECNKALRFLQHVTKRKTDNPSVGTSYGLKHAVERYLEVVEVDRPKNCYVANGAFICAALHAGFTMKTTSHGGPNVTFNMSSRSPIFEWRRAVDRAKPWQPESVARAAELARTIGVRVGPR